MKAFRTTLLALCLGALTACEKDEPEHYPVTMRFSRIEPVSGYLFYAGEGRKIDDPVRMERFRNTPIRVYPWGGDSYCYSWTEPDGAQFDRIDFPDKDHFRMLWAKGGEDRFDVLRHDGMHVMVHPSESEYIEEPLYSLLRWREGNVDRLHPATGMLHSCLWGRFTSTRRFEMEWMQIRARYERSGNPALKSDILGEYSNAIDPAKVGLMGPRDTLVVRHYKVIFTR